MVSQSHSNEVVIIVRPSFKKFCGTDACQAALFNHFLYWIAKKAEGQAEDKVKRGEISWYGSADQICDEGLDNSWSVNKVRKEVNALVADCLVGQRHNPVKKWDQTMHYFISEKEGKVIREQFEKHHIYPAHLGLSESVLHLLNLVNAFTKCGDSNCQICEIDLPNKANRSTKFGNAIPKNTAKTSTKITDKESKSDTSSPVEEVVSPSTSFTTVQYDLFLYYCELEKEEPANKALAQEHCAKLETAGVRTREHMQSLHAIAAKRIRGDDKRVKLGNMSNDQALSIWKKEQEMAEDQWWDQSKRSEEQRPAYETVVEALPADWQIAVLTPDLMDWIIALTQDWHDDANMQANVAILQEIYRQAQRGEVEFYDALTSSARVVAEMPEYERMDRFFEDLCTWLKIPMPYTPAQNVIPITMEEAV